MNIIRKILIRILFKLLDVPWKKARELNEEAISGWLRESYQAKGFHHYIRARTWATIKKMADGKGAKKDRREYYILMGRRLELQDLSQKAALEYRKTLRQQQKNRKKRAKK